MKQTIIVSALCMAGSFSANAQWWNFTDPAALPGTVNGVESEESMPVFSKDSSVLYFVRTFDAENDGGVNDQDVWQSTRQSDGSYSELSRVKNVNNKFHNGAVGISKDGTKMYLLNTYDGKKDLKKGIAVSEGKNGSWGTPDPIEVPGLDIEGEFYGFHMNEKGDVMIISYKGPNTLGEEDLYVSTKSGGVWSAPQHMGSTLNSAGYEISPFLTPSQDTLFFSSNGMGGQGDADIFYSVKQGSWTSWSKPQNLGNRINSPKFDAYFIYTGKSAYWSSNRDRERADIYMIDILTPPPLEVSCTAKNATRYEGTDGSVNLTIKGGSGPFTYEWSNGASSEDLAAVGAGEYSVVVKDNVGQQANTSCSVSEPEKPVAIFENYQMKHLYDYNKDKLTVKNGELRDFVEKISKDLENGRQSVTINIYSSASRVPTKTFGTNEKLAQSRADNIKADLEKYFKDSGSKVTVKIVKVEVAGPEYQEDSASRDKYAPYQFIELKTN